VDVLLLPVTQRVAPKIPEPLLRTGRQGMQDVSVAEVGDVAPGISARKGAEIAAGLTLNTCPFNLSGHPALSMPCGWAETDDGAGKLPVGMQLVGKRWGELDVLKAAMVWEVGGKGLDNLNGEK